MRSPTNDEVTAKRKELLSNCHDQKRRLKVAKEENRFFPIEKALLGEKIKTRKAGICVR